MLRIVEQGTAAFDGALEACGRRGALDLGEVEPVVREIVDTVRKEGDAAVSRFTERFERRAVERPGVRPEHWKERALRVSESTRGLLSEAVDRVRAYHLRQVDSGFSYSEGGITLGMKVSPLGSVGVYAPGGKAQYPSSVIMAAVPAAVAGVKRIVLATPDPGDVVLAAAELSGVTEVFDMGGAQAIAALAYGTETVPSVHKIVGPGNIFVACAKQQVFGHVGIDQIAGPSEILVVADDDADPRVVAADLLSQAEHDEAAYALLVTLSRPQADAVAREVERQLERLPRVAIARASIDDHGLAFVVEDLGKAAEVVNLIGPEHLALSVADPEPLLARITSAGAVFVGRYTPEAAGDYAAGPSHVLPTGGAARFGSPLGVYDFVTRMSVVEYSKDALRAQASLLCSLARLEGLEAHARAVEARQSSGPDSKN